MYNIIQPKDPLDKSYKLYTKYRSNNTQANILFTIGPTNGGRSL